MAAVRQRLTREYGLETQKADKATARVEDAFEMLRTLWESLEIKFQHECQRIQLALILHLAGLSGNRPETIMNIRYGDVAVELIRAPELPRETPPRVVVKFTFVYTKDHLVPEDLNEFTVPDIHNEPCLLLCPQTTLLALFLAENAFHEDLPTLDKAETIFELPPNTARQLYQDAAKGVDVRCTAIS